MNLLMTVAYSVSKVLEDEGMQIVDVDQKTWKQMQEKCQPVYDSIRKQAGDKLVDLYMGK